MAAATGSSLVGSALGMNLPRPARRCGGGLRFFGKLYRENDRMKTAAWVASLASAFFAICAAVSWVISTKVETKAIGTGGIGPGLDGYLVVKNVKGEPIHFIPTFQQQSLWSSRAAWAAALAALCQAVGSLLGG